MALSARYYGHHSYGWEIGERSGERDTSHSMLIALVGAPDPPNDEHTNDVEILHEPQSPGWRALPGNRSGDRQSFRLSCFPSYFLQSN
ncbi:hypothetical protein N7481_004440 [Penicillium waksmanii]|uniref:uncharacterized protein n=1 Tax=Penicillium waksmanii TaxID=69791 RepID=UPI002546ECF4|nr:uncharacterized protein N7481_004440 [Penicillium waksmanii]KAJ5989230.1 hypothetical protein N7481_004440 [Penicillium waksmanii]